jgi:hypothetical protein
MKNGYKKCTKHLNRIITSSVENLIAEMYSTEETNIIKLINLKGIKKCIAKYGKKKCIKSVLSNKSISDDLVGAIKRWFIDGNNCKKNDENCLVKLKP